MGIDRHTISHSLLTDVKAYLGITWNDTVTDNRIRGFIASSMVYLDGKLGAAADYEVDGAPRELLMERVRYARDSALDVFENNYMSQIVAMQNDKKVSDYVANAKQTEQCNLTDI